MAAYLTPLVWIVLLRWILIVSSPIFWCLSFHSNQVCVLVLWWVLFCFCFHLFEFLWHNRMKCMFLSSHLVHCSCDWREKTYWIILLIVYHLGSSLLLSLAFHIHLLWIIVTISAFFSSYGIYPLLLLLLYTVFA